MGALNLEHLHSFFAIVRAGSLNKAAEQLRVSQSTLTRQVQALESDVGGALLERSSTGVTLTATGSTLVQRVEPALRALDQALGETRRLARGQSSSLRIGYLVSAGAVYLNPALVRLRAQHPEVKVSLFDLSPGEQLGALRRGEIDLALLGCAGKVLGTEFYMRRIESMPVYAALSGAHPLAGEKALHLAELRGELLVGARDEDLPGFNRWLAQVCRRAGFRPRMVGDAESLMHGLSLVVSENAVAFLPEYATRTPAAGVAFVPLLDTGVRWDLFVAWQRGRASDAVRSMVASLTGAGNESPRR